MPLSTHYYVLALSTRTTRLCEAFRDDLFDIRNRRFPHDARDRLPGSHELDPLLALARAVDEGLGLYCRHDPLGVVVVGDRNLRDAFRAVTAHASAVIGSIDGDHSATSARDLGQITWPLVKEAISGLRAGALRHLEASAARGRIVCGLESVLRGVSAGAPPTLLVEEGYRARGSIVGASPALRLSPEVDVRDAMDDAVDAVIEMVLARGGEVVFMPDGSLEDRQRVVLLRRDESSP